MAGHYLLRLDRSVGDWDGPGKSVDFLSCSCGETPGDTVANLVCLRTKLILHCLFLLAENGFARYEIEQEA